LILSPSSPGGVLGRGGTETGADGGELDRLEATGELGAAGLASVPGGALGGPWNVELGVGPNDVLGPEGMPGATDGAFVTAGGGGLGAPTAGGLGVVTAGGAAGGGELGVFANGDAGTGDELVGATAASLPADAAGAC
jgi:hypothetical protein